MKKLTTAFQLDPIPEEVTLGFRKSDETWYPLNGFSMKKNEMFIYGEGIVKTGRWKKVTLQPFSSPYTAAEVKTVADEYGLTAAMGMIRGWGNQPLFHDQSYGLYNTRFEVANMASLGKQYDDFTDLVQEIGDKFLNALLENGFHLMGTWAKGWLYYGYRDEENYGNLVGQVGIYNKHRIHPLQHIDHYMGQYPFLGRVLPMFDSVSFDGMLATSLFYARYDEEHVDGFREDSKWNKMLAKIVSVRDRIAHLTGSEEIADSFNEIFEEQKKLDAVA